MKSHCLSMNASCLVLIQFVTKNRCFNSKKELVIFFFFQVLNDPKVSVWVINGVSKYMSVVNSWRPAAVVGHCVCDGITSPQQSKTFDQPLSCTINCSIFSSGTSNVVVQPKSPKSAFWIAKARLPEHLMYDYEVETSMLSEISTINHIHSAASIPVPVVYAFDTSADIPLGRLEGSDICELHFSVYSNHQIAMLI